MAHDEKLSWAFLCLIMNQQDDKSKNKAKANNNKKNTIGMEVNKERLGPINEIHEYFKKYGIKHTIIIRENEVVLCANQVINEHVIWDGEKLSMEMVNGVILPRITKTGLREYIKISSHSVKSEKARKQLEWAYPNQEIDFQAIEDAMVNDDFVEKYMRLNDFTIRIETRYYGKD